MVSLVKLSQVTEDGVKFQSPHDQSEMLLTPEKSIQIQNIIGKDRHVIIINILFLYKRITKNIFRIIHRC